MSNRKLKRCGLPSNILEKLIKHNILTSKDLLSCCDLEVIKILSSCKLTVDWVKVKCSEYCSPKPQTAYDIWKTRCEKQDGYFKTSLYDLDLVLHGGLPTGTITEIAGPAGCGKTQFSIMLSVIATIPKSLGGLHGSVLYIDTEGAFSAHRFYCKELHCVAWNCKVAYLKAFKVCGDQHLLLEIASCKYPDYFSNEDKISELTQNVHVDVIQNSNRLLQRLQNLEEDIISKNIKLVIVDSIASLVRKEYSTTIGKNLTDRTNLLAQEAAILKYVAEVFSIPVVVTNQITTRFTSGIVTGNEMGGDSFDGNGGLVTAALGNTWSHSVNTRLILQYLTSQYRQVMVAKSPVAPFTTFTYTIESSGLVQQDDGAGHYEGTDPGKQQIKVRSALPFQISQSTSLL